MKAAKTRLTKRRRGSIDDGQEIETLNVAGKQVESLGQVAKVIGGGRKRMDWKVLSAAIEEAVQVGNVLGKVRVPLQLRVASPPLV